MEHNLVPRLYVKSAGEQVTKVSLQLTNVPHRCVVRLTGGCGSMSVEDAKGLYALFAEAFRGFAGAMLFGGTRMLRKEDKSEILPGITEIPPFLRELCPDSVILGVVPRTEGLALTEFGLVVECDSHDEFFTVVHPNQDIVLVVQVSADDPEVWDAEYRECLAITRNLRDFAGFASVLVAYNGGTVTRREIEATAERGWPVVLIRGSGRVCDELASDERWLKEHPGVVVAEKDAVSLRCALEELGALTDGAEMFGAASEWFGGLTQ